MTITSTARKAGPLLGNGAATTFPFSFKVFAAGDIKVVTAGADGVEAVRVLGADYSVVLNANQETSPGGTVTYPISGAPLASGSVLSVIGDLDYDQPLDLPSGGNFSPLALENQLDRTVMQVQQLHEEMGRTAKLPVTSLADADSLVADIVRLADSVDNIDTVAGSIAGVDTVASNIADVNTVAAVAGAVAATGSNIAAVVAVGNDLLEPVSEINTVATDIANVNTVGTNISSVNMVAGIAADVTTVAGNVEAINTVATNVDDVTNFADVYQGAKAFNPTLRNDGSALQPGDLYFNTVENALRAYSGTVWVAGTAGSVAVQNFSGDGVTAAFTLATAPASENNTQVYISGVYQQKDQYSVSGTALTFSSAPPAGANNIEVVTLSSLSLGETDAALVAYLPAGVGAVAATVQNKLRESVSVKDFGAIAYPTNTDARYGVDLAPALTAALAASDDVFIPSGHYRIDSTIVIPNSKTIRGSAMNRSVIHAGDALAGLNMFESQSVYATNGPTDTGIVLTDLWLIGGWGVELANGIELGCRNPGTGVGVTFNLRRLTGYYLQNGIRLNGATYSQMDSITLNGLDERSSGTGVNFTGLTNNVMWTSGLVGDFGRNITMSGDSITMVNVNSGTAVNGAYGVGWANTWTQSLLAVWEGRNVKTVNCTFEHLATTAIDEVEINSFSANAESYCFDVTLEDCRWMGINSTSRARLRLGVAGVDYKTVKKINLVRCSFLTGIPNSGLQHGDVWVDNALSIIVDKCVRLASYQDGGTTQASLSYTSGSGVDSQVRSTTYFGKTANETIGAVGAPAFQNGWSAYGDPAFTSAGYFFDNRGFLNLVGMLSNATPTNGVVVFTLPAGCRPPKRMRFSTYGQTSGAVFVPVAVDITSTGDVRLYFSTGITEASISGVSFLPEL